MTGFHNYDRFPRIHVSPDEQQCLVGWPEILGEIRQRLPPSGKATITFECYPGVLIDPLLDLLRRSFPRAQVFDVRRVFRDPADLEAAFSPSLTDDPVFGIMRDRTLEEFFHPARLAGLRSSLQSCRDISIVVGTGACYVQPEADLLLHAGVTRWELQARQRSEQIGNLGFQNIGAAPGLLYKNAFFLEWRVGDAVRHSLYKHCDFFLDLDQQEHPAMLAGPVLRRAVAEVVQRPFRVEPFFDPGPWGGEWMRNAFDLPLGPPNYAWCFDCVPEENSVTLAFGQRLFRMPAILLVHEHPLELLGRSVYQRFGAEFPIRFDLLDTVLGGNLSLQVHPLASYIKQHFGMNYTQDESYYILDREPGAELYLGLRNGVRPEQMSAALRSAHGGDTAFPAETFVNTFLTHRHDHFSIPAGTVHCSGAGNMLLEISATPYIFTFKLWDWGRIGLDGRPRPIHLEHGLKNIQWNRDRTWVEKELLHQVQDIASGPGWREQRTGLHASEFLETRRTWFVQPVHHHTQGNLNVLNLVEGEAVQVASPTGAFPPLDIHYAETFVVPACVGEYTIRPAGPLTAEMGTVKAYVRP